MQPSSAPIDITDILKYSHERNASDIILTVGIPPQFKVHGDYSGGDFAPLTGNDTRKLMYAMMNEKQQRTFEENRELDFSFALTGTSRFRVNCFMQRGNVSGVMRLIPTKIRSVEELGLPQSIIDIAKNPRGLVLVTGPTGSGKSTTLAALIDWINVNKRLHIVTIEDPIEFMHGHKQSVINQREIGSDTHSFQNALKSVLRQAPDVILVGEMRDYDTISMAVTAAETGHLVMGTLHTNSAPESIDRIVDVFPEAQQEQIRVQLANNLVAVMTQQILPLAQGGGRVMAYELLLATPAVRALIRENKSFQLISVMQTNAALGMVTMDATLAGMVKKRLITYDIGLERAVDPKEFARLCTLDGTAPGSQPPKDGAKDREASGQYQGNRPGNAPAAGSSPAPAGSAGQYGRR